MSVRDQCAVAAMPVEGTLGAGRSEAPPWRYLVAFLVGTVLIAAFMWLHVRSAREDALAHWRTQLEALADSRVRLVAGWLAARRADAEMLAVFPQVQAGLAGATGPETISLLDRVTHARGYASITLVGREGQVLARASDTGDVEDAGTVARTALEAGQLRAALSARGGLRLLHVAVPVHAAAGPRARGAPLGAIVFTLSPHASLDGLLASPSPTSPSTEALLFTDRPEPAYLTPLRGEPAAGQAVGRSLELLIDSLAAARLGRLAFAELVDHRAASVLAATRPIEPVGWGLTLKINRDEALAEFHDSGRLVGLAAAFLVLALGGFLIGFWRQEQRAALLSEKTRQERAIFGLKSYAERIVASVPSGLLVLSGELRVLSANRAFLESFSLRTDEVLGRPLDEVVRAEGLVSRIREVGRTGVVQHDVHLDVGLVARRETRPTRVTISGIQTAPDEEARLLLIVQDLSGEERLQAAQRASEQRLRDLVQGLDGIVWEADAATFRFTFVSQRAEAILGYPVEHWLRAGRFFAERIHPEDRDRVMAGCRDVVARGGDLDVEYRALAADGRTAWLRDSVQAIRDASGQPRQLRGLTVDLTERKRAEEALVSSQEQLRQAQKMEAVGRLAGGVAHDFNNLLMVIQGDSELILRRLPEGHALRRNAEGIREAAQQAAALTRQLLAFSRKQVLTVRVLDLGQIVASLEPMLRRLLGETISLATRPAADTGYVKADPGQIEQVVMNLVVNARDAMPDGGTLTIETAYVELDEAAGREPDGPPPGRYVALVVSDSGAGMDEATRARLFEPFFTTKEQGKGTGLGVSTVYGIVRQSGGHIGVESVPGRGTTFRIYLPRVEAALEATGRPADERPAPARAGVETVLLVEDAQRVREVVREILEMNGYTILEARNGAEAIQIAENHMGRIQLVVTDVVMPEMSGCDLAARLVTVRPDVKVLYMSGYTDDAIVRHGVLEAGVAFLPKPFTPDALAAKVRQVLDGAPPAQQWRGRGGRPGPPPGRYGGSVATRPRVAAVRPAAR